MQTEKHGWRDNSIEELQSQIQIDVFVGKGPMFLPKRLSCDDEVPHGHVVLSSQTRWLRQLPKPNCLQPSVKCSASAGSLLSKSRTAGSEALWWGRDLLRRMVARCLAHTYATPIHQACQPHQFALSTRAGTEAVVHALTAATEQTPDLTILSIDGVGAFDTISRQAMLQGLAAVPEANRCIPFVRMFYAQPSAYIWHDNAGAARTILQAEGGEQGDPLMPALFSLGQRAALQRAQQELQEGEHLFAFLDDVYVLSQPARIRPIYDLLAHHLHAHARIRLNSGKPRIWNAAGSEPPNIQDLGPDVWVGNPGLPRTSQGLVALGAPVGTQEYKQQHLQQTLTQHTELLQAIPTLDDLQASWLLLLFCASPRCNYHLRMLAPEETATFAQDHDTAVAACFTQLLDTGPIPATSLAIAHLPLHLDSPPRPSSPPQPIGPLGLTLYQS